MSKYYNVYAEATVYTKNFIEVDDEDIKEAIEEMVAQGLSIDDEEDVITYCYEHGYCNVHNVEIETFEDEVVDTCQEVVEVK